MIVVNISKVLIDILKEYPELIDDNLNFKHPCSILSARRALALGVMKAFLFVVPGVDFCIVSCIFGKMFLCVKHLIDSLVHVF